MKQIFIESYYGNGYSRFMRYFNDILEHPGKEAIEHRLEIIKFFDDYGAEATRRAFGKGRSTVFLWKQKLEKSGGKLSAIVPGDKTPLRKRKRIVHPFITDFILKYRADHPGVDKTTITPVLVPVSNATSLPLLISAPDSLWPMPINPIPQLMVVIPWMNWMTLIVN